MAENSPTVPAWLQIFLALIAMVTAITVAYINRPASTPPSVQTVQPTTSSFAVKDPEQLTPKNVPTSAEVFSRQTAPEFAEDFSKQSIKNTQIQTSRQSLNDLIGIDVAIGDSMTQLKKSSPNFKWEQIKTSLFGELNGTFLNKIPGLISVRIRDEKVDAIWFEMRQDGGTVDRVYTNTDGTSEEKSRNEYDTVNSYSKANKLCYVFKGLRSEIIKALGTAAQFDDFSKPEDLAEENKKMKYIDFEQFYAKYKLENKVFVEIKLHNSAYVKVDTNKGKYIETTTSSRECSISVKFIEIR